MCLSSQYNSISDLVASYSFFLVSSAFDLQFRKVFCNSQEAAPEVVVKIKTRS